MPVKPFTIYMEDPLLRTIKARAAHNRRSASHEICYLVEAALAIECDVDIAFLRNYILAKGGVENVNPVQEAKTLEQTETDEAQP